jgi:hypothetical protein|nr:MAG TPA: hypothetical protein [Caudoviricetes sp.]
MKEITFTQLAAIMVALTEALDRNTNALLSQQGLSPKQEKASQEAVKESAEEREESVDVPSEEAESNDAEITMDMVQSALLDVKAKHGADAAKAILKEVAGVATVKRTPEDKYQDVIDACTAKMEEEVVEEKAEEPVTPKHSLEDVKTAAKELGALGREYLEKAKEIIADVGGAAKTADVPVENYDKLHEALVTAKEAAESDL